MNSKLTCRDADFIRLFTEFGFRTGQLAKEYDVHPDTIRNVKKGASHKVGRRVGEGHRKLRKLSDEHVRFILVQAAEGAGEQRITTNLRNEFGIKISRSTVRQVMIRKTYQDVEWKPWQPSGSTPLSVKLSVPAVEP